MSENIKIYFKKIWERKGGRTRVWRNYEISGGGSRKRGDIRTYANSTRRISLEGMDCLSL